MLNKRHAGCKILIVVVFVLIRCISSAGEDGIPFTSSKYRITDISTLVDGLLPNSGHLTWSPDGKWIIYDALGNDGFTDIWRIRPDGSGKECVTCDNPGLPDRHIGNATWHPSGRWIVFQAESPSHFMDSAHEPCKPGSGYFNDLYAMDIQSHFPHTVYRLTSVRVGRPAGGSLHPHFSPNGEKLLWGDLERHDGYYGNWRICIAAFVLNEGPKLVNMKLYEPTSQPTWFETHAWRTDGKRIYFSATPIAGMNDNGMDICAMDLAAPEKAVRLTYSSGKNGEPEEWDEHAQVSPRGDIISYISSTPYGIQHNPKYGLWMKTDLWLMNIDGTDHRRITFFNEAGHTEYQGRTIVADNSWNPVRKDNPQLAIGMYCDKRKRVEIKIITFNVSYD